jgi:hypothetical protein
VQSKVSAKYLDLETHFQAFAQTASFAVLHALGTLLVALLGVLVSQQDFGLVHEVQHHAQRFSAQPDACQQVEEEGPWPREALHVADNLRKAHSSASPSSFTVCEAPSVKAPHMLFAVCCLQSVTCWLCGQVTVFMSISRWSVTHLAGCSVSQLLYLVLQLPQQRCHAPEVVHHHKVIGALNLVRPLQDMNSKVSLQLLDVVLELPQPPCSGDCSSIQSNQGPTICSAPCNLRWSVCIKRHGRQVAYRIL